jgi:octaprenyl-diphosphate synthase
MKARLEEILRPIAPQLAGFEEQLKSHLSARSVFVWQITEHILTRRGKRLRPAFVFLSAGQMQADPARAMLAALAVELIHTATLLHDDVIDVSSTRRGQATVNSKWNNLVSVLMGDYLFSKAFTLLVEAESADLTAAFSRATERVSVGQLVEIQHINNLNITEADYFALIADKTASLFAISCEAGAILAECSGAERERIRDFGEKVGIAFQISDDLLDIVGLEEVTGKTAGNDLREGKVTLPLIYTLQNGNSARRDEIVEILGRRPQNGQIQRVAHLIREAGGVEYAQEKAIRMGEQAFKLLEDLPASDYKKSLEAVARFAAQRER